jgi:type IV pilus assembly protein PilB
MTYSPPLGIDLTLPSVTKEKNAGKPKRALGQRLIEERLITEEQLEIALREQKRTGELLGKILRNLGFVKEDDLSKVLFSDMEVPRISLSSCKIDPALLEKVPKELTKQYRFVPVCTTDGIVTVAMANPYDVLAVDTIQQKTGWIIDVVGATDTDILACIEHNYREKSVCEISIEACIERAKKVVLGASDEEDRVTTEPPIIDLVNHIIEDGIREQATDIHIEPEKNVVRIRYRVDGILHQGPVSPKELQAAIASRLKLMAGMNISERRAPQDGRIKFESNTKELDIRVSAYPTSFGEDIALRILDRTSIVIGLENLGLDVDDLSRIKSLIQKPYGILLATGPTGSGKTTTLYSILVSMDSLRRKIVTIEDPVEYQLPLIRQSQINPKAGLTFVSGLRSILRQDPDVIMVGEIRDSETAEIAVRSALTGHFVLSTLHTNTAIGAVPRLSDMGVEPYLLGCSLTGVIAQRLVRRNCLSCVSPYEPKPAEISWLGDRLEDRAGLRIGEGCDKCKGTGYKGRIGIFELLLLNDELNSLIAKGTRTEIIHNVAAKYGMRSMKEDGIRKILSGVTTVSEVMRVVEE